MIKPECFTRQWCEHVTQRLKYNDIQLIEKVVRAFSLLEMLVQSGCPFHFKGGKATMLLLGGFTNRLSIDIDIICPPGTEIEEYLTKSMKMLKRLYRYNLFQDFDMKFRYERRNRYQHYSDPKAVG